MTDATTAVAAKPRGGGLDLEPGRCCLCGAVEGVPVGVGEDFAHRISPETFLAVRCRLCGLVYLDPRPAGELTRLQPVPDSERAAGPTVPGGRAHRRLLARLRALDPAGGSITHVGSRGKLPAEPVDVALLVGTIEQVQDPAALLDGLWPVLAPRGRVVILTANAGSAAFGVFKHRYWAGYDFPRHRYLFDPTTLSRLAQAAGYLVEDLRTAAAPEQWTHSVRNLVLDLAAPPRWLRRLGRDSAGPLAAFGIVEAAAALVGRGGLVQAVLRKPA